MSSCFAQSAGRKDIFVLSHSAEFAVEGAVLDGFGDVRDLNVIDAAEVGDGAGDFEQAGVGAGGEADLLNGRAEQESERVGGRTLVRYRSRSALPDPRWRSHFTSGNFQFIQHKHPQLRDPLECNIVRQECLTTGFKHNRRLKCIRCPQVVTSA